MVKQGNGGRIVGATLHAKSPAELRCSQILRCIVGLRKERYSYLLLRSFDQLLRMSGNALLGAYSSSKFAVRGLTQCAGEYFDPTDRIYSLVHNIHQPALELGEHGITVNAYAPGIIQTDMSTSNLFKHIYKSTIDDLNAYSRTCPFRSR